MIWRLSEAAINDIEDRRLVGNEKTIINGMTSGFPEEVIRADLGLSDISVTCVVEERAFFLLLVAIRIPLAGRGLCPLRCLG